jgi:hypothetical protein
MRKKSYREGKHYQERAKECRAIAEILATGELRAKMLNVAAEYERMADLADELADEVSNDSEVPALR